MNLSPSCGFNLISWLYYVSKIRVEFIANFLLSCLSLQKKRKHYKLSKKRFSFLNIISILKLTYSNTL